MTRKLWPALEEIIERRTTEVMKALPWSSCRFHRQEGTRPEIRRLVEEAEIWKYRAGQVLSAAERIADSVKSLGEDERENLTVYPEAWDEEDGRGDE